MYVKYIDPDNIPYAKMTFYYQGIPRLRRMGLLVPEKLDMGNEVDSLIMGICKKLDIKNESDSSLKEDSPKTGGSKRKNSACQHMLI